MKRNHEDDKIDLGGVEELNKTLKWEKEELTIPESEDQKPTDDLDSHRTASEMDHPRGSVRMKHFDKQTRDAIQRILESLAQGNAEDIVLEDSAGHYTATDVEAALAEMNPLATLGDFIVRGTSVPERLAAGVLDSYLKGQGAGTKPVYEKLALKDTGIKIGSNTRNTSGTQAITGVGFSPSVVIFVATQSGSSFRNWSVGFDKNGERGCLAQHGNGVTNTVGTSYSILIQKTGSPPDFIRGYITAFGSDGFTITWDSFGTVPLVTFLYLCLP